MHQLDKSSCEAKLQKESTLRQDYEQTTSCTNDSGVMPVYHGMQGLRDQALQSDTGRHG